MGRIKELKPFAKTFFILIAVFFVSMTLVYCIPTSWIQGNVEKSIEVLEGEGEYPMYFFYRHSAIIDIHTDKLMYESLIQNRDYYNPIQAAMSINQYPRYWHGYQVLLRPLTVVFQVQELRYLGMLTFHLLFFWSAWLMAKETKPLYAMFYVLTVASGYVVFLPVCFQFLTTFLVLFVSALPAAVMAGNVEYNVPMNHDWWWTAPERPQITVNVVNNDNVTRKCEVWLNVATDQRVPVTEMSQCVTLQAGDSTAMQFLFDVVPGFYRCTVTGDGKEVKKFNIGFEPENIVSLPDAQPDFDEFWQRTIDELAAVDPEYSMTEEKDKSKKGGKVYLVKMKSLGGVEVQGYLTMPSAASKKHPMPETGTGCKGAAVQRPPPFLIRSQ